MIEPGEFHAVLHVVKELNPWVMQYCLLEKWTFTFWAKGMCTINVVAPLKY